MNTRKNLSFMAIFAVFALFAACSDGSTGGANKASDFDYREMDNGGIIITKYKGAGGSVAIPGRIEGKPVTSIGGSAFEGCTSLASVTIPNSVTEIGNSAFNGCTSLASVTIPNSVTTIGEGAFDGCTSLASVTLPANVTNIWSLAFPRDLMEQYYAPGGGAGTYTTTNPGDGYYSVWTKQ